MRANKIAAAIALLGTVLSFASYASLAHADEEFDVSVASGKVTVTSKGAWHVNKDYPWKLVAGDQKLDKTKFSFTETSASVSAPKGTAKLKGGVCSGDKCKTFEKDVTIP